MFNGKALTAVVLASALLVMPALAQQQSPPSSQSMPHGMMGGRGEPGPMGGMAGGGGTVSGMGPQGGPWAMMGGRGGMGMMSAMAGHVEGRIAFIKAELKITDAQLPLWNAVADAMRASAKNMTDMWTQMTAVAEAPTLPDKLAAREKLMEGRLDALRKLKSAVDPLYAALSDTQKKTADQLVFGMGVGGGMGMGPRQFGMRQR